MCTLVVLYRPGYPWPVLIGANRDEMTDRPWRPPARHWEDRPYTIGGLDELAGGTWLGLNDEGLVAAMLNRTGSLGPAQGRRTRGELTLEALEQVDADLAAEMMRHIDGASYRPFNMVLADNEDAFVVMHRDATGQTQPDVQRLPPGLSVITAVDPNDREDPRIRLYRPLFQDAATPDPEGGDWHGWEKLLASRLHDGAAGPLGAMTVVTDRGYGTVSSSLIALPDRDLAQRDPIWLFAEGRPGEVPYRTIDLE